MWQGFTGWHALIILVVILLLFGAPKLPALARSLGQSMKILKSEVRPENKADGDDATTDAATKPEEPDSSKTA
jgi:sec-independent protein translocase protein TatA